MMEFPNGFCVKPGKSPSGPRRGAWSAQYALGLARGRLYRSYLGVASRELFFFW